MGLIEVGGVFHTRSGFPLTHQVLLDRGPRSGEGNFAWRKADLRPSMTAGGAKRGVHERADGR